jgi:hypothetical protein
VRHGRAAWPGSFGRRLFYPADKNTESPTTVGAQLTGTLIAFTGAWPIRRRGELSTLNVRRDIVFDLSDPKTFWLNITNLGLGLVVVVCCIAVARTFLRELLDRRSQRVSEGMAFDDHTFMEPELGLTMADGGEKREKKES